MTDTEKKTLVVECPNCGNQVRWTADNEQRPFCSRRCKDADFIDWAEEKRSIAGSSSYDDVFSDGDMSGESG